MSTISIYTKQNYTPTVTCTITSANPGNGVLKRWSPEPTPAIPGVSSGSDANNMQLAFGLLDSFGLPIPNTAVAPNFSGNVSGLQTPNVATYQVSYVDGWVVLPVGVTVVRFRPRGFGNTAAGIYVGKAPRYATRIYWANANTVPNAEVDMSNFHELCGQKIAFVRSLTVNGYFNGGHFVQISTDGGTTFFDVTGAAMLHGSQPYLRKYPS